MSNTPAKYEVLIKQYLLSILSISAERRFTKPPVSPIITCKIPHSAFSEQPLAGRRRPILSANLENWRQKMFRIFHHLQSDMVLESVEIPVREYSMPSSMKKVA